LDKFVPALLLTIIVARFFPGPAIYEGAVTLHNVGDVGITLIFLFYGLKLNPRKLRQDLSNWKLHMVIQLSTFLVFPLIVLPFLLLFGTGYNYLLWLGAFFLATLPSTVSSSVVMVSIAKGNVPGAIFNASISSLLGIVITPIWMGLVITSGNADVEAYSAIITKLILQVLVPVLAGLFLNRFFGHRAQANAHILKTFDQTIILLIVYLSFAESFYHKLFSNTGSGQLFIVILFTIALFYVVYGIISIIARKLKFSDADTTTALFAGSKKSLVHGTVMAGIIFSGFQGVGVVLLPLMVYHAMQLVVTGFIAKKKASRLVQVGEGGKN
jgi:solute carrier family 10 (sodium/bile acid cotransporter), member 7